MPYKFGAMAFGDNAWFSFDFTGWLTTGDAISGTPMVTVGAGISIVVNTLQVVGGKVIFKIMAGSSLAYPELSCSVVTVDGYLATRSGIVPVVPNVPS